MLYHFDGVCLCSGSEPPINNKPQRPQPTRQTSWKLVGNPGCQPGFPTSFQLVRLLGCGLKKSKILTDWGGWSSWPFEVDLLLLNAKVNTHYIVSSCWRLTRHLFSEKALTSVNHFFQSKRDELKVPMSTTDFGGRTRWKTRRREIFHYLLDILYHKCFHLVLLARALCTLYVGLFACFFL